jgi:hypothetical protein
MQYAVLCFNVFNLYNALVRGQLLPSIDRCGEGWRGIILSLLRSSVETGLKEAKYLPKVPIELEPKHPAGGCALVATTL